MKRRTGLIVGAGIIAAGGAVAGANYLLGGTSQSAAAPAGWTRQRVGALLVPVPNDWQAQDTESEAWTSEWAPPSGGARMLVAPSLSVENAEHGLRTGLNAMRALTRGFTLAGEPQAVGDSTTTLIRQDYDVTWPQAGRGTLWSLGVDNAAGLVSLFGEAVTDEQRRIVGGWLQLDAQLVGVAGAAGFEWMDVSAGTVSLQVPKAWVETGAVAGSERWLAGWAAVTEAGIATSRVLVAPSMPQAEVVDAMAQIEVDAEAGALPGFKAVTRTPVDLEGLEETVRVDFTSGSRDADEGCIWVFRGAGTVAAVQYVTVGSVDTAVRDGIERSLRLN